MYRGRRGRRGTGTRDEKEDYKILQTLCALGQWAGQWSGQKWTRNTVMVIWISVDTMSQIHSSFTSLPLGSFRQERFSWGCLWSAPIFVCTKCQSYLYVRFHWITFQWKYTTKIKSCQFHWRCLCAIVNQKHWPWTSQTFLRNPEKHNFTTSCPKHCFFQYFYIHFWPILMDNVYYSEI